MRPTPQELTAAIHAKCMECSGGSRKEVHGCKLCDCPLWPYRRGEPREKMAQAKGQIDVFDIIQKEGA